MRITLAVWPFRPCARYHHYHYHYRRHHHAAPHRRTLITTSPHLATTGDHPTPPPRWSWHNVMKPVAPSPSPPPVAHRINTSGGLGDATVTLVGRRPKTRRTGERTGGEGALGIRRLDVIDPNRPRGPPPHRREGVRACVHVVAVCNRFFHRSTTRLPPSPSHCVRLRQMAANGFFFPPGTSTTTEISDPWTDQTHRNLVTLCRVSFLFFVRSPSFSLFPEPFLFGRAGKYRRPHRRREARWC